MHDDDARKFERFERNTGAYYAGTPVDRDETFEPWPSNRDAIRCDEIMAAFDNLDELQDCQPHDVENDPPPEKSYAPVQPTRIEKAVAKQQEIERQIAELAEEDNFRRVMLERILAEAAERVARGD